MASKESQVVDRARFMFERVVHAQNNFKRSAAAGSLRFIGVSTHTSPNAG